ncbi:MAG TPA: helix-turn-helix domain-containing protein [Candidatus Coproplasma excrementipullorum]|nr:helix-turn-helix domain-containing protein [Candidatus Coproplasma excrementipullorum]
MVTIEQLKQRKKELRLTNAEVAQRANMSVRGIEDIFSGKVKNPRLDTMQALETALGLSDQVSDEERLAGVVDTKLERITALEEDMLIIFREVGEKLGEPAQRVLITTGENLLKINK